MQLRTLNVAGIPRMPAFSHAVIVGRDVHVSGMIGALVDPMRLVDGGVAAQTTQALLNVEAILAACGCRLADVVKVNVYLTDMIQAGAMNSAYMSAFGEHRPARITVGCTELALGALIELDCTAVLPDDAGADAP